jgi:hypothetical protein
VAAYVIRLTPRWYVEYEYARCRRALRRVREPTYVNERQNHRRPIQPFTQKLADVRDRLVSAGRRDLP